MKNVRTFEIQWVNLLKKEMGNVFGSAKIAWKMRMRNMDVSKCIATNATSKWLINQEIVRGQEDVLMYNVGLNVEVLWYHGVRKLNLVMLYVRWDIL